MKISILALCVTLITACATGPAFIPMERAKSDTSVVYIYRPYMFKGSAASPKIYIDDEFIGKLGSGNYVVKELSSGEHDILVGKKEGEHINWAPDTILQKVKIEPGKEYYFRMELDFGGVSSFIVPIGYAPIVVSSGTAKISLNLMEPEVGLKEISETKLTPSPPNKDG